MKKKLLTIAFVLLACVSFAQSNYHTPYDPGAVRKTDQAVRVDTTNASISNNLDVAGDVGAATVNGVAPLTAAEKTQALVGSSTVDWSGKVVSVFSAIRNATGTEAAPSYSFAGDTDTGFFSSTNSVIDIVSDGLKVADFSINGLNVNNGIIGSVAVNINHTGGTYGEIQAFYSGIGYTCPVVMQRQGGNILIATSTDDGVNKLQVNGSMRLIGGAAPGSPTEGSIYFNSTDKKFYGWNGTAWKQLDN